MFGMAKDPGSIIWAGRLLSEIYNGYFSNCGFAIQMSGMHMILQAKVIQIIDNICPLQRQVQFRIHSVSLLVRRKVSDENSVWHQCLLGRFQDLGHGSVHLLDITALLNNNVHLLHGGRRPSARPHIEIISFSTTLLRTI